MRRSFCIAVMLLSACGLRKDNRPETMFDINGSIMHDGHERTYIIHLPPDYYNKSAAKMPLVIGLHGGFGDADNFRNQSGLNVKADAENFIIVYPDGLENPGTLKVKSWNAGKCCAANALTLHTDDVGFISTLIDEMISKYKVDPKRVYATGHSNGAMLCYTLADELSEKIAAIAPTCGNIQTANPYDPTRNVPVINVASKLDTNVKYLGGISTGPSGHYNPPTDSCLNVIASLAGCTTQKTQIESHPLYSVFEWNNCSDPDFKVKLYLVEDGGHSWPGGEKGWIGADAPSQAFENNDVIWEFLKQYSLR